MDLRLTLALAILATSTAFPATALAQPVLSSDRSCYREGEIAKLTGNGFPAASPVALTLDGRQLGTLTSSDLGVIGGELRLGSIPEPHMKRSVIATDTSDPTLTGSLSLAVTKVYVGVKPEKFKPGRSMRIRAGGRRVAISRHGVPGTERARSVAWRRPRRLV